MNHTNLFWMDSIWIKTFHFVAFVQYLNLNCVCCIIRKRFFYNCPIWKELSKVRTTLISIFPAYLWMPMNLKSHLCFNKSFSLIESDVSASMMLSTKQIYSSFSSMFSFAAFSIQTSEYMDYLFLYLGFLSLPFMIHRTAGKGEAVH